MKKDIQMPLVEGVYVAITQEEKKDSENVWYVYLINDKEHAIENVLVNSRGYLSDLKGAQEKSSVLRHFYKVIGPKSAQKVEVIVEEVFKLNNEFFVSFYANNQLYDKRFVFVPDSIQEKNFSTIPVIQQKGVWIK